MSDPVDALTDRLIVSERLIETLRAELQAREAVVEAAREVVTRIRLDWAVTPYPMLIALSAALDAVPRP